MIVRLGGAPAGKWARVDQSCFQPASGSGSGAGGGAGPGPDRSKVARNAVPSFSKEFSKERFDAVAALW